MEIFDDTDNWQGFIEKEHNGKIYAEVCSSKDIFEGKGRRVEFPDDIDMQVAIFKINGKLYALDNICPHRHAEKIFDGIIDKAKMTVTCPLHGWTYSIVTGENVIKKQGVKSLKKYEVYEENGKVIVEKPQLNIPRWRQISLGKLDIISAQDSDSNEETEE